MLYCYFGHHKCASTWLVQLVHDISSVKGFRVYEKQIAFIKNQNNELSNVDFYICQTSIDKKVKELNNIKGFHVIRDPRDIIVSGYFSHLYSHPTDGWDTLTQHRKTLQTLDKDEGLLKEIDFSDYFIKHIYEWDYNQPNILELKMEDLTQFPEESIKKILGFLNLYKNNNKSIFIYKIISFFNRSFRKLKLPFRLPIYFNDTYIKYIANLRSFKNMSKGRSKNQEDIKSHYRKGVPNDWKNHFKPIHLDYFNQKYPNIIDKLGYKN